MSDSFDEQFNDLTNSIGNITNIDDIKPNNEEETSNLINKLDEIENKDKIEDISNTDKVDDSELINQIFTALENNDFVKAESLIIEAQTKQIKNDKLYLAIVMFDMRVDSLDLLGECLDFYDYSQNSNNYNRAFRYSDKELQDTLNSYVNNSYCKNIYLGAKGILDEAKKANDNSRLEEAANMLSEIGDYKDSKSLFDECCSLLRDIKNKETNYEKLLITRKYWKTGSIDTLNKYKKEIENLKSYKDSDEWLREISVILEKKQKGEETFQKTRKVISIVTQLEFLYLLFVFFMGLARSHGWITINSYNMQLYGFIAGIGALCFVGLIFGVAILVLMDIAHKFY